MLCGVLDASGHCQKIGIVQNTIFIVYNVAGYECSQVLPIWENKICFYKLDYSKLGIIPAQICKYLENEK